MLISSLREFGLWMLSKIPTGTTHHKECRRRRVSKDHTSSEEMRFLAARHVAALSLAAKRKCAVLDYF
jgi:hypothetical protein